MSLFDETDFLSLSRDLRDSLGKKKTPQSGGNDKLKRYREQRVEVLRRLYAENPVEEKKILVYEHPSGDGRKNIYEFDAVEENPYSPFDDLELLEELMPNTEDFI